MMNLAREKLGGWSEMEVMAGDVLMSRCHQLRILSLNATTGRKDDKEDENKTSKAQEGIAILKLWWWWW